MMRPSRFLLLLVIITALSPACTQGPDPIEFPSGFQFGTATAGFQVDMECPTIPAAECEDRNSDWYTYISTNEFLQRDPLLFLSGDPPGLGPGFYELYEEDLDRAKNELNNTAFRLSIEWSRIFPEPTDGIEGYDALLAVADPKGIVSTIVCLQPCAPDDSSPLSPSIVTVCQHGFTIQSNATL